MREPAARGAGGRMPDDDRPQRPPADDDAENAGTLDEPRTDDEGGDEQTDELPDA